MWIIKQRKSQLAESYFPITLQMSESVPAPFKASSSSAIGQEVSVLSEAHPMPSPCWWRGYWKTALTPPCRFLVLSPRSIADWLKAPDTMFLLDFIKPEFLLLRVSVGVSVSVCVFSSSVQFNAVFRFTLWALIVWSAALYIVKDL